MSITSMSAALGTSTAGDGFVAAQLALAVMFDRKNEDLEEQAEALQANGLKNEYFDAAEDGLTMKKEGEGFIKNGSDAHTMIQELLNSDPGNDKLNAVNQLILSGNSLDAEDMANFKDGLETAKSDAGVQNDKVMAVKLDALAAEVNFFLNLMKGMTDKHGEGLQTASRA